MTTHPQYHFVDVTDGKLGLGILTEGLTEYEILADKKRTIAVTMIRAFRDVFATMPARRNDPGAQSQRLIEFKYSICPHAGDYQRANLFAEARRFNLPLEAVQTGRRGGPLGNQISFLSIEPASLILSAMKQSQSGKSMIVRFFNPLLKKLQATISCFGNVKQVWQTNLNEERIRELKPRKDGRISIAVKPKKIITLEIMSIREK
jgi:alpha-mannosidase